MMKPTIYLLGKATRTKQVKPATDFAFAFVIVAVTIGGAFAENAVNCDDVMRRLKGGPSPRDLARYGVSFDGQDRGMSTQG